MSAGLENGEAVVVRKAENHQLHVRANLAADKGKRRAFGDAGANDVTRVRVDGGDSAGIAVAELPPALRHACPAGGILAGRRLFPLRFAEHILHHVLFDDVKHRRIFHGLQHVSLAEIYDPARRAPGGDEI